MEDDLNFFENRRRPQIFKNERRPQFFFKWKTTTIFLKKEDDLNFFENGRQPQFFLKMEDDLKKIIHQKTIKIKAKNKPMVVAPLRIT